MTARPHSEPQSAVILEPAPLPVDWDIQEEEWRHHLRVALGELVELRGSHSRLFRPPEVNAVYHEYSVTSTPALSPIQLHWTPDGVLAVLPPSPEREASRPIWTTAINQATRRLGTAERAIDWVAYVADDSQTDLAEPVDLGRLTLKPSGKVYQAIDCSGQQPSLTAFGLGWCFPVQVEGKASGVNWETASQWAGEDLYRLCAVLSVAFDSLWTVKQFAHPRGQGAAVVPSKAGYLSAELLSQSETLARRTSGVPEGLGNAWERAGEPWLAGSLSAHHRALACERNDPTTAMTLFVAAIEGVGGRYVPLRPCGCGTTKIGARRRFRYALDLVLSADEAKPLVELYDLRSGAAHGDLIAGQPLTADPITRAGWFYASPEHRLRGKVWDVRQASTHVLQAGLWGRLPEPESASDPARSSGNP